jgi:hypothetical protein
VAHRERGEPPAGTQHVDAGHHGLRGADGVHRNVGTEPCNAYSTKITKPRLDTGHLPRPFQIGETRLVIGYLAESGRAE